MRLEDEAQRIVRFLTKEKERVLPQIQLLERERSSANNFVRLARRFVSTLEREIRLELKEVLSEASFQPGVASQRLDSLFRNVETALAFLSNVAVCQTDVPRELYQVIDWFLGRFRRLRSKPQYILLIGSDLATLDFRHWLELLFPRLTKLHKRFAASSFSFIHLPGWIVPSASALDWPLIFHECAHAVENIENVIGPLFPYLPPNWGALNRLAKQNDPQAQEALLTHELVCDYLATCASGPVFVWRFTRDQFSVSRVIHQSSSHPTPDIRIGRLISVLRELDFASATGKAESMLTELLRDVKKSAPQLVAEQAADRAQKKYSPRIRQFRIKEFRAGLRQARGAGTTGLFDDILRKRPVLLDPACLFTLVAFDERCEDPRLAELLADSLRLHAIQSQYQRLRFSE